MVVNVWTEKRVVGSEVGMCESLLLLVWSIYSWDESLPPTFGDQHCPHWAVGAWSAPDAIWEQLTEAKLKLGPSLAMVAPINSLSLVSRQLTPSFPTWNSCWPPPSLEELLSGPGGTPELVVGTFVLPLNSPSKCEPEHLALAYIPLPSLCCCARALASG